MIFSLYLRCAQDFRCEDPCTCNGQKNGMNQPQLNKMPGITWSLLQVDYDLFFFSFICLVHLSLYLLHLHPCTATRTKFFGSSTFSLPHVCQTKYSEATRKKCFHQVRQDNCAAIAGFRTFGHGGRACPGEASFHEKLFACW